MRSFTSSRWKCNVQCARFAFANWLLVKRNTNNWKPWNKERKWRISAFQSMWVCKGSISAANKVLQFVEPWQQADAEELWIRSCGGNVCGSVVWLQEVGARQRDSGHLSVCIPPLTRRGAPDRASMWCSRPRWLLPDEPEPDAWGPPRLLGAFADSDRAAGCWVMEFLPAESESHWQTLAPPRTPRPG